MLHGNDSKRKTQIHLTNMSDLQEVLQKIEEGRTDTRTIEANVFLNDQEVGYLKEILLSELSQIDASATYKGVMVGILQKLNSIDQ